MALLKLVVFNVERGLCVYVRTPNGYAVLIDCGRSQEFSPASWIAREESPTLEAWNGHALAWLIITHPHDDHVEDIATIKSSLSPAILLRHKDHDWQEVLHPPQGYPSENVQAYYEWQTTYSAPVTEYPDLGLSLDRFALSPAEAGAVSPDTQHLLNNSSYVTVLTYLPPGKSTPRKVVVAGDNEAASWEALLRKDGFPAAISGADFFITSHHGHESGFSRKLFDQMGKPVLIITSERAGDESVFDYSPYARGTKFYGEDRYHITTRNEGHIVVYMDDQLQCSFWASAHE